MSKQALISLVVIIAGIAGLVWWSKSVSDNSPGTVAGVESVGAGVLTAEETLYDFGTISMKNGNVSKIFRVANSSGRDVNLESITTSCMCTNAYILSPNGGRKGPFGMPGHGGMFPKANEIIKAGEIREIEVVYDPNAHGPAGIGRIDRFIWLVDESGNKLELEIKANVTP